MLKPLVPKFRYDLSISLRDIAEKQVPAKLKPIVAVPARCGCMAAKCLLGGLIAGPTRSVP